MSARKKGNIKDPYYTNTGFTEGNYLNTVSDEELTRLNGGVMPDYDVILAIRLAAKVNDEIPPYSVFEVTGLVKQQIFDNEFFEGRYSEEVTTHRVKAYTEQEAEEKALVLSRHEMSGFTFYKDWPVIIRLREITEVEKYDEDGKCPQYTGLWGYLLEA